MRKRIKAVAGYRAAKSSRLSKADIEAVGSVLDRLANDGEGDVARRLVDASKPRNSPTHHLFEWDVKRAAEAHWLDRARDLIAQVEVVFHNDEGEEVGRARAFPSINIGGGQRNYVPIKKVLNSRELTEQLLEAARLDAESWVRRHEALRQIAEASVVFEALDGFIAKPKKKGAKRAA